MAGHLKLEGFQVGWETLEVGARTDVPTCWNQELLWESRCTELGGSVPPWKGRQSPLGPVPDSNCEDGLCIHIEINKDLVMRSLWTWEGVRAKQREIWCLEGPLWGLGERQRAK